MDKLTAEIRARLKLEDDKRGYVALSSEEDATLKVLENERKPKKRSITALAKKHMADREKMKSLLYSWGEYKSGDQVASPFKKLAVNAGYDQVDHDGYENGISDHESLMIQIDSHISNLVARERFLIELEYRYVEEGRVDMWSSHYGLSRLRYEKVHRSVVLKMAKLLVKTLS